MAAARAMVGSSRRGRSGTLGPLIRYRSRRPPCSMKVWSGLFEFAVDPGDAMRSRPFSCLVSGRPGWQMKVARPRSSPSRRERLSLSERLWISWEKKDCGWRLAARSHLRLQYRCALRNDQHARGGEVGGGAEPSAASVARCRSTLLLFTGSTRLDPSVSL